MRSRFVKIGLPVILILVLVIGAVLWFFSDQVLRSVRRTLEGDTYRVGGVEVSALPASYGLPEPESFVLDVSGSISLSGWYFENEGEPTCGVVLLHGYSVSRINVLPYAPIFWERGCDLVLYDARSHGASIGKFVTYGFFEKDDALLVVNWLMEKTGLDVSQIGLVGVSFGGATALQAAALEPDLAFVLADSSYESMARIIQEQGVDRFGDIINVLVAPSLSLAGLRANFDPYAVSPSSVASEVDMPIFLIHSTTDSFTNSTHSEAIFAELEGGDDTLHLTNWGSAHAQDIFLRYEEYKELVDDWLDEFVPLFAE